MFMKNGLKGKLILMQIFLKFMGIRKSLKSLWKLTLWKTVQEMKKLFSTKLYTLSWVHTHIHTNTQTHLNLRDSISVCWITTQMSIWLGEAARSWEPRTQSGSPMWVAGTNKLELWSWPPRIYINRKLESKPKDRNELRLSDLRCGYCNWYLNH